MFARYVALGDSMSIDRYTGIPGGGAASQFAAHIRATQVQDLSYDGCTTNGVLAALAQITLAPDIITLTAGGNDLLLAAYQGRPGVPVAEPDPLGNLTSICERLAAYGCPVIINTVYDPTDGNDAVLARMGIDPAFRRVYEHVNDGIRALARRHGFLLADLQRLFHGHGLASPEPWLVQEIEPNLAGATAIAQCWYELL